MKSQVNGLNQSFLRFLKLDQTKLILTSIFDSLLSREYISADNPESHAINKDSNSGEATIPTCFKTMNIMAVKIRPHATIRSNKSILSIQTPSNLLAINPMTTPEITPITMLTSKEYLKKKFSISEIRITAIIPESHTLSSFDTIDNNSLKEHIKFFSSMKIADVYEQLRANSELALFFLNGRAVWFGNSLYQLATEEIKVDNTPITNIYPSNPINNSINVYFFDWKDNSYKIWS